MNELTVLYCTVIFLSAIRSVLHNEPTAKISTQLNLRCTVYVVKLS